MTRDPDTLRRSPRLPNYDYCQPGIYFVTICVQDRRMLLGQIVHEAACLSPVGLFAQQSWESLPRHFPFVELDMHVIMPNHFHGLIVINELPQANDPPLDPDPSQKEYPLGEVVRRFKALTTRAAHEAGIADFDWQEQYWDAIIRSERHLHNIRRYILNNPAKWTQDLLYQAQVRARNASAGRTSPTRNHVVIPLDELPF